MAKFVRTFTKKIFIVSNIILVILFLLALMTPYLNPRTWWFVAILGLGFPFLLVLNLLFVIFWLIFRSRWAILSFLALLLSYTNIRAFYSFHRSKPFVLAKDSSTLRVLTWNVSWFDHQRRNGKAQKSQRREMLEFVVQQKPDIICFQEFLETNKEKNPNYSYSNLDDLAAMGYLYSYWSKDYSTAWGNFNAGPAIVSRYPIIATYKLNFTGPRQLRAAESLIGADIDINGSKIRVFTTHLQSLLLQKNDYRSIEIIRNAEDSMMEASRSILRKLKAGYDSRSNQADMVRREIDKSPFPEIICGDFNDVPNSYTYFTIKGDRKDAYLEKGSGIGRTYTDISPTLRIDYIITNPRFEVLQVHRFLAPYSDHYPVVADLRLE